MKVFLIVNPGVEEISAQELSENTKFKAIIFSGVIEFEAEFEKILVLTYRLQTVRRILIALGKFKEWKDVEFAAFSWSDFFSSATRFKIRVEGVQGEDNRREIARHIAGKLYRQWEKVESSFAPQIDLKKPQLEVIVYFNGSEYFLGIDFCGRELDARYFRVFPHSSSFKGDLSAYFVRRSLFKPGERLLAGFCKDGAIPIEAVLLSGRLSVQNIKRREFSFFNFPYFKEFDFNTFYQQNFPLSEISYNIFGFDENRQNILAARKNSFLAGTKNYLELEHYFLDDLDVKFSENYFDRVIFYMTTKDEEKLNEIYYQTNYILRKGGTLLLVTRKNFEMTVSGKFDLLSEEIVYKGDSAHKLWLLEKK